MSQAIDESIMMTRFFPLSVFRLIVPLLFVGGCTLGPNYQRPELEVPTAYREDAPWKEVTPADSQPKGPWWTVYGDPVLNDLQARAGEANQDIKAAVARLDRARAAARIEKSDLWPRIDLTPSAQRGRTPADLSAFERGDTRTTLSLPFDLGYEIDLWGRVRRSVEAATEEAWATAADLENLRLSLHAEVARNYFALRALDAENDLLKRAVDLRSQNLELVQSLFLNGEVGRLDVARAETELATAQADLAGLNRERSRIEHALAVLAGEAASNFELDPSPLDIDPPAPTPGLPSHLLERRPDVAAAERRLVAANARIGVAETAFFPDIRLTGSAGFGSNELSSLFSWDNRAWALGPAISLPIFTAGRNQAGLEQAQAAYDEEVARYRQSVLTAFQEVEDSLADLRILAQQAEAQQHAVTASREAAQLSNKRYRAGMVSYLEVVDSERTALTSQRLAARILGQRLQASVSLIKALGGDWRLED